MLLDKTIIELSAGLQKKEFSSVDLINECYGNIEKYGKNLNVFITLCEKAEVLKRAQHLDETRTANSSLIHGIPYVLKDAYVTKNIRTTAASNVLKTFIPPYNATVYEKVEQAGGILIGKANMDAWGHGSTTENTDFGPTKNPWDTSRSAGGSGGGPAAAIAARFCSFAIGEDTGGSIRNPANWCNITGLKVTYGRVSRYGAIPYVSSFDTVGPTAKTAAECAYILEIIAGKDPKDASSSPHPVPKYSDSLGKSIKDIHVALPKELYGEGLDPEVKNSIMDAKDTLSKMGVKIHEISMPIFDFGLSVYYLIAPSETSSNLGRYDGIRYGLGRDQFTMETMRRIMVGTYALSAGYYDAYYKKAQQARTLFIQEYQKVFRENNVLLMPVMPTPAVKFGELTEDPVKLYLSDVYTVLHNPVGIPSLAIPCGFSKNGLPIGMQLVGKMFDEPLLFQVADAYQKQTDWHTRKPVLLSS
jgi:aspartyl-tRNA(Asn)/glutamyl-tRNA(Gln) amidotransferase subunit A